MTNSSAPSGPAGSHPRARIDVEDVVGGAALLEGIAGFAVLAKPVVAVHLVFGPDAADGGIAQCFGIALVAFAIACWPIRHQPTTPAVRGLCVYNGMIAVYLTGIRTIVGDGGPLLWPAVMLHALVALLLVWKSSVHEVSPLS